MDDVVGGLHQIPLGAKGKGAKPVAMDYSLGAREDASSIVEEDSSIWLCEDSSLMDSRNCPLGELPWLVTQPVKGRTAVSEGIMNLFFIFFI